MANLSSFFPEAAAAGGIGKTVTVGDYSYPNAIAAEFWYESALIVATSGANYATSQIITSSSDYHYNATIGTSYTTIGNVTSATNGGALYFAGFQKTATSSHTVCKIDVKITIDGGTAKEKSFYYSSGGQGFMGLYGYGYNMASYSDTTTGNIVLDSYNLTLGSAANPRVLRRNYDSTNEFFYSYSSSSSKSQRFMQLPAQYCVVSGIPYLHFTTSCKIEMKKSGTYDENLQVFSGFATIYTF